MCVCVSLQLIKNGNDDEEKKKKKKGSGKMLKLLSFRILKINKIEISNIFSAKRDKVGYNNKIL